LYIIAFLEEGMTFIDIGAHFGFFTLFASYLVREKGRVLAFEPSPKTYYQLQKNITSCCKYANAEAYNYAAYSENDKMRFYDYGLEDSSLNSIFGARNRNDPSMLKNEIMVQTRKVDDVLTSKEINKVDVVKIDAESSEIHVLTGFRQTLKSCKPKIILEVGDYGICGVPKSKEIITHLQQMDYSPYEVCKGEIVPHVLRDTYEYGNLLFINNKCHK
jgi:FkbM family methyltransferase